MPGAKLRFNLARRQACQRPRYKSTSGPILARYPPTIMLTYANGTFDSDDVKTNVSKL